ncbi:uncharacterized protein LOC131049868 [Cryptomeria japonica]|uniref:uncharacterized protein LOC131049868 n=1 Tax=Cryptomeria japonica TaxID=3369 RepID=UPI0027DA4733|nr:uncharacterized protein LOC131049868 [Cryptomeria japonica]
MQEKLRKTYEEDDKIKKATLQTHKRQFESLKMKDEENVAAYFLCVDEIINTFRDLGEKIEDDVIVQKVLRYLPIRVDVKVSAIEEMKDLDTLMTDELHGILPVYEMRTENGRTSKLEAAFKDSRRMKNKGLISNKGSSDEEKANFMKKFNKGSIKNKSKYTLQCFNCGNISHFVGSESNEKEEVYYDKRNDKEKYTKEKSKKKNFLIHEKSLYTRQRNSSSKSDESFLESEREEIEVSC